MVSRPGALCFLVLRQATSAKLKQVADGSPTTVPAWKAMTSWINTEMEENLVTEIWTKINNLDEGKKWGDFLWFPQSQPSSVVLWTPYNSPIFITSPSPWHPLENHDFFDDLSSFPWRIHGPAILMVPWIPSIYPSHVSIYIYTIYLLYTSTMDPMGFEAEVDLSFFHHKKPVHSPSLRRLLAGSWASWRLALTGHRTYSASSMEDTQMDSWCPSLWNGWCFNPVTLW